MNFKVWNMNKGLKSIWIIGTVFLVLIPFFIVGVVFGVEIGQIYGLSSDMCAFLSLVTYCVISIELWWGLLYLGFWSSPWFCR